MRIASLVPSATEMLFALGLGDGVVAVTHECDHPPAALERPHVTRSVIPAGLSTAEIDRAVRERTERGEALYELDAARLDGNATDWLLFDGLFEAVALDCTSEIPDGGPLIVYVPVATALSAMPLAYAIALIVVVLVRVIGPE